MRLTASPAAPTVFGASGTANGNLLRHQSIDCVKDSSRYEKQSPLWEYMFPFRQIEWHPFLKM